MATYDHGRKYFLRFRSSSARCNTVDNEFVFGRYSIRLKPEMYQRAQEAARKAGYSSVDELVAHAVEREIERMQSDPKAETKAEIEKQLRGLGYIE